MVVGNRSARLLCFGVLVGAAQAGAQAPKIALQEAIDRANLVQPSVISAGGTVRNAQARQRSASGAFLPSLTLSGSRGEQFSEGQQLDPSTGQFTTSGTSTGSAGATLSSSIDIFAGFRRTGEKKAASATRDAADAGLSNARFQQQLTTTNQFFDVLAAEQLLRVRDASVRRAEEQLKVSVAKLHAGRGIRPDSLRSVVTLGNAQLQLINQRSALATAEANLGRLVGADAPVGAVDDSTLYTMLPTIDSAALRQEAVANSPSVKAAEASAVAARAAVQVSRASYYPTLNLSGSASMNGSSRNSYSFLNSRQINLGLNWPIFNRFQREQGIVNSLTALENAEAQEADSRRLVLSNLSAAIAALEAARLTITITQTSVLAAEEDLRIQQERYRLGAATIVDILTSQEALNQAEVDAVTARFDYVRARASISALIGRTL